jgi:hypothetical protein
MNVYGFYEPLPVDVVSHERGQGTEDDVEHLEEGLAKNNEPGGGFKTLSKLQVGTIS